MNKVTKRFLTQKTFDDSQNLETICESKKITNLLGETEEYSISAKHFVDGIEFRIGDSDRFIQNETTKKITSFVKSGTPKEVGAYDFDGKYDKIIYSEKNRENNENIPTDVEISMDGNKYTGWYKKTESCILFQMPYIAFEICEQFNSVYEYVNRIITRKFRSINPTAIIHGKIEYSKYSNKPEKIGFSMFPEVDKHHEEPMITSSTIFRMVDDKPIIEISTVDGQVLDYSRFDREGNILSRKTASYFKSMCDFVLTKYEYEDFSEDDRIVRETTYSINGTDIKNSNTIVKTQRKLCSPTGEMRWYTIKEVRKINGVKERVKETIYRVDDRKKISNYSETEYSIDFIKGRKTYLKTKDWSNDNGDTTIITKSYYNNRVESIMTETQKIEFTDNVTKYTKEVVIEDLFY